MDIIKNADMKLKDKKLFLIIGALAVAVVILSILYFKVWNGKAGYRSIRITEANGTAIYEKDNGKSYDAVENMNLESGCTLSTEPESYVVLRLDDDKYVTLEENSTINLYAERKSENGKTRIELVDGGVLNEIQNPLTEDASYEVKTPGATMSVRGTVFEVCYDAKTQDAELRVYAGTVALAADGNEVEERLYNAGEYTQFHESEDSLEFLTEKGMVTKTMISPVVLAKLEAIKEAGRAVEYEEAEKKESKKGSDSTKLTTVLDDKKSVQTDKKSVQTDKLIVELDQKADSASTPSLIASIDVPAATDTPIAETPITETPSTEKPSTETPSTETPSTETPSTDHTDGAWVHLAVPAIIDADTVYCSVSETACTVSTEKEGTQLSVTNPVQFWGYDKTYQRGETVTPTVDKPKYSTLNTVSNTFTFTDWRTIGSNTVLSGLLTNGSMQLWDTTGTEYYATWQCGTIVYYPIQITIGNKSYYMNVPSGCQVYINSEATPTSIYSPIVITVQ